jgi:hypothetical protein
VFVCAAQQCMAAVRIVCAELMHTAEIYRC